MNSNTLRQKASLYLLVGVLLFVATGALAATPHDHDPSEYCRICSIASPYVVSVADQGTEPPELETSTAPSVVTPTYARECLLATLPLRGPPATS